MCAPAMTVTNRMTKPESTKKTGTARSPRNCTIARSHGTRKLRMPRAVRDHDKNRRGEADDVEKERRGLGQSFGFADHGRCSGWRNGPAVTEDMAWTGRRQSGREFLCRRDSIMGVSAPHPEQIHDPGRPMVAEAHQRLSWGESPRHRHTQPHPSRSPRSLALDLPRSHVGESCLADQRIDERFAVERKDDRRSFRRCRRRSRGGPAPSRLPAQYHPWRCRRAS